MTDQHHGPELDDLPRGWARATLGELGTWYGGGTPSKSNEAFWTQGDIPWLSPKDMGAATITDTADHITADAVALSATRLVPANSVVVVMRSGILERTFPVSFVPFETTLNQDMRAIVPHDGIDPRWLVWALRACEQKILHDCRKTGTTVASIETSRLMALELPTPPLAEQHRIAETLDEQLSRLVAAQRAIERAMARIQALEWAAAEALVSRASKSGTWQPIAANAHVQGGILKNPSRAPRENKFPFLRVANVARGSLFLDDVHEIELSAGEIDRWRLEPGDLLVVEGNGSPDQIGRAAVWSGEIEDCVHQNHLIRVRPSDSLDSAYLGRVWNSPSIAKSVRSVASTTTGLYTLSTNKIKTISIPVPPLNKQRSLVHELDSQMEFFARQRSLIVRMRAAGGNLRRSLLRAAFTGRLVPQNPDDEPAFALVDRIHDTCTIRVPPSRSRRSTPRAAAPHTTNAIPAGVQEELPL